MADRIRSPFEGKPDEEKIESIRKMFGEITPHYDLLNHLLSGGQDFLWRAFAVSKLPENARVVLDVATGTGDLALDIVRKKPYIHVTGLDFVPQMLDKAREKTEARKLSDRITYLQGDAMELPFEADSFDAATVAFGLRNMPDRVGALREMARVVKPGGRVLVLEMTFPENLGMRRFFSCYFRHVIPFMGSMISGNRKAYEHLPSSIQDFPKPDQLSEYFKQAGMEKVDAHRMTFGITYLHCGTVV
jgi:demethylmenaquinone methyltransferase/2-methoxy-6-polyprenyl-1,4-benzoquinol methylase